MKNNFKANDGVWCNTEEEYEALKAVILADGFPVYKGHSGYMGACYYGIGEVNPAFLNLGSGDDWINKIPLSEAIFRGAPDFATLLVKGIAGIAGLAWLEHNRVGEALKIKFVFDEDEPNEILTPRENAWHRAKVIAQREPQKTPVQQLAEILSEWPDCHGKAGLLAKSHPEFDIVVVWRGNAWHTATINGVTKSEWLDAITLNEQDMIKLAGRDIKSQMVSDIQDSWHKSFAIGAMAESLIDKGWVKK